MEFAGSNRVQWQAVLNTVVSLFRFYNIFKVINQWSCDSTSPCAFMARMGTASPFLSFIMTVTFLLPAKQLSAFLGRLCAVGFGTGAIF